MKSRRCSWYSYKLLVIFHCTFVAAKIFQVDCTESLVTDHLDDWLAVERFAFVKIAPKSFLKRLVAALLRPTPPATRSNLSQTLAGSSLQWPRTSGELSS